MLNLHTHTQNQESTTEVVVIAPSARRDGVCETIIKDGGIESEHSEVSPFTPNLRPENLVKNLASKDLDTLASRLGQFVEDMAYQIKLMESAIERSNYSSINVVAKKLAARCADIGSYRLMQLSYKLHICAKVNNFDELPSSLALLSKEFEAFRKQLIIA